MKVRFSKKWVNPIYWELEKLVKDKKIRSIHIIGGKGSSKTFVVAQFTAKEAFMYGKSTMALRKENSRIKTTLKKTYQGAIKSMRLSQGFETQDFKFKCRVNDSEIVMSGLDDLEKIKGLEGFTYLVFDETNQFSEEEIEQGDLSMRALPGQKIFHQMNPVSEKIFVKTNIIDGQPFHNVDHCLPDPDSYVMISEDGMIAVIKTSYPDNYWVVGSPCGTYGFRDESLIAKYEALKKSNYESYRVNVKGDWGVIKNESPFFYNYNTKIHEVNEVLKPLYDYSLVFSWDFNVEGCTCLVGQLLSRSSSHDRLGKYVYDTIEADNDAIDKVNGKGATDKVCDKIIERGYLKEAKEHGTFALLRVTGDRSGNSRNTKSNMTDYQIIRTRLGLSKSHFKVNGVNLGLGASQNLSNEVLANIPVTIVKPLNPELCNDLSTGEIEVKKDGSFKGIKKDRKNHKQDKGDAFRYFDDYFFPAGFDTKNTKGMSIMKWMKINGVQ